MKLLHVTGPSESGKTRLIENLLTLIPATVVVKWTHHSLDGDKPNSDTARFRRGGTSTILAAPDGLVIRSGSWDRERLYSGLNSSLDHDAMVIVEGNKHSNHPKIWVGALVAGLANVALAIGPDRFEEAHWLPADLPLSDNDAAHAARFVAKHLDQYTVVMPRDRHE